MSNPSTDPHSYEANTQDETKISNATLIVQNGLGYDDFINKLESSSENSNRTTINVSKSLGYSNNTPNPHLWYNPDTMEKVAKLITENLEIQLPDDKKYFQDRLTLFDNSLKPWKDALNEIQKSYSKNGVAVTEPVANYLLEAANLNIVTPWGFQASVMNGTDPSPQNVKIQEDLLKEKKVKVFVYNKQSIDDVTTNLLNLAKSNNIPVVGVYETMPPKHTYQTWMEDETKNILKALKDKVSTENMS
jgi:zinc/manganese transport system substrate-binding protein